jgi:hypothetical protein
VRCDRSGGENSGNNCEIAADDRVLPELHPELPFGQHGAREHHEAAGLLIEAMDDPQAGEVALRAIQLVSDCPLGEILECRIEFAALLGPFEFRWVSNGVDTRRFLNHNDVVIEVPDDKPIRMCSAWERLGMIEKNDHFVLLQPARFIGTDGFTDLHSPCGDEFADIVP